MSLMDVLSGVGTMLDTPWAFVRTGLAGENPFPGIFDPSQRIGGRELLERLGAVDPNEEGLDSGDVGGFLVEMLDPFTLIPGYAAGKYAASLARGFGKSGRLVDEPLEALSRTTDNAAELAAQDDQILKWLEPKEFSLVGGPSGPDLPIVDAPPKPGLPPPPPASVFGPKQAYHGTRAQFDDFSKEKMGGLAHFAEEPYIAQSYAQGMGGYRQPVRKSDMRLFDDDGIAYDFDPASKQFVPVGYTEDGRILSTAMPDGTPISRGPLSWEEAADMSEDGYLYQVIKPENTRLIEEDLSNRLFLDLTKPEGRKVLGSLDPQGSGTAQNIIRDFNWSDTKHEPRTRVWERILGPQLKGRGYGGIAFQDDMHRTYSKLLQLLLAGGAAGGLAAQGGEL